MTFKELPAKHKKTAINWAIELWEDLYKKEGITANVTKNSPEVKQYLEDEEYEIECGEYEKGISYERLIRM